MIKVTRVQDLGIEQVEGIAFRGERVTLEGSVLAWLASRREQMVHALEGQRVYGVNTGMGYLASIELTETQAAQHQRNLLLGRAVGSAPWLSRSEARAVIALRLINLLSGHAGVTPRLCTFLVDRLNDDFVPAIPRRAAGSSGEVLPLAHAFQTVLGVGSVLSDDGVPYPAADALAERNVAPYKLQAKEGIALLSGAPATAALGLVRARSASRLVADTLVCWAAAIDALQAPLTPYSAAVAHLENDALLDSVLGRLGRLLESPDRPMPRLQAPVSFRVVPQVLTHVERSVARLEEDVRRAAAAVTDSPAVVEGGFVGNGSFHRIEVAAGMDALAAALVRTAELSAQHLHRLLDHRFSGLPDQLTPTPGPRSGLIVVQKRATGILNELRRLAAPASVGLADTSFGQEDAQTYSFEAAENLRRAEELTREVLACELLTVRQAWALRGGDPAPGLAPVAALLAERVAPIDEDRPLGPDIDRLLDLLTHGGVGAQVPPPRRA
jgi:histidine ammonia-lyase